MNLFDLMMLLVLFVSVAFGIYRGAIASLLGLASCLLSLLFAFAAGPRLAAALGENRGVTELLSSYTDATSLVGDYSLATTRVEELGASGLEAVLGSIELPASIESILQSNLSGAVFASKGMVTVNDYVSATIVSVVLQGCGFVLCFFLSFFVLHLLINLLAHVLVFPSLLHLDGLTGGFFGLLRGVFVLYALFLLVPLLQTVVPYHLIDDYLGQSLLSSVFASEGFFTRVVTGG